MSLSWSEISSDRRLSRLSRLASSLLSGIFPSACPICKNTTDNIPYAPICKNCWTGIRRYTGPSCRVCAAPLVSPHSITCSECLTHKPAFASVISFGIYSGALREAIHLLKFTGVRRLTGPLGNFLAELEIPEADAIIPVPLSKKALRKREFNQTLLLARVISKHSGIPVHMDTLYKKKDTLPQIGLGAKERRSNVKNVFESSGNAAGLRIILLDDVMTTGATARECAKTLIKAGAKEVIVVTLARAVME